MHSNNLRMSLSNVPLSPPSKVNNIMCFETKGLPLRAGHKQPGRSYKPLPREMHTIDEVLDLHHEDLKVKIRLIAERDAKNAEINAQTTEIDDLRREVR